MLPFVVDMARLFEMFVFSWMSEHLSDRWQLSTQETIWRSTSGDPSFVADLVLRDSDTGGVYCVLDTKYKAPQRPAASDVEQVVAYATALGCRDALLLYPKELAIPFDERVGDVRVRSATFSLAGDLDESGWELLAELGISGKGGGRARMKLVV